MRKLIILAIVVGIVGVAMGAYAVWLMFTDAPPIPNDYTVADLRSAPSECDASFQVLSRLAETGRSVVGSPATGLTGEDVEAVREVGRSFDDERCISDDKAILAYASSTDQAWNDAQKGREIVVALGQFSEIADLTPLQPMGTRTSDPLSDSISSMVYLIELYRSHVLLEMARGNEGEAARELIEFDSALRKLTPNIRSLLMRLVCTRGLDMNVRIAASIVSRTGSSRETAELLAGHFVPLAEAHISFRNSVMFEYLEFEATVDAMAGPKGHTIAGYKRNSTLRLYRNLSGLSDGEKLAIWPKGSLIQPDVSDMSYVPLLYKVYNFGGTMLVGFCLPAVSQLPGKEATFRIDDDMLQIALSKRLGRAYSLKARAYGDEYIIDANSRRIVSPGPDKKMGTRDDIWLPIYHE
jgi:hypothetical protein